MENVHITEKSNIKFCILSTFTSFAYNCIQCQTVTYIWQYRPGNTHLKFKVQLVEAVTMQI